EMWATLYNRVGVVKRHVDRRRVLFFPFVEGFGFGVAVDFGFAFCSCDQGPLLESCGGRNWFHQPSIRSLTSDHDSLFRLPDVLGEARRPISPTMTYSFTRVAHGLPCVRTSCA